MPFPDLGDELTKRRMEDPRVGQRMYAAMTAAAIAQTVGRCMLHENDECVTFIIDGHFARMWKESRDLFPPWFGKFREYDSYLPRSRRQSATIFPQASPLSPRAPSTLAPDRE